MTRHRQPRTTLCRVVRPYVTTKYDSRPNYAQTPAGCSSGGFFLLFMLQHLQHARKFLRQGARHGDRLIRSGMAERQLLCMEALGILPQFRLFVPVDGVAQDRMPE